MCTDDTLNDLTVISLTLSFVDVISFLVFEQINCILINATGVNIWPIVIYLRYFAAAIKLRLIANRIVNKRNIFLKNK